MKGLEKWPTMTEMAAAYDRLQSRSQSSVSEKEFALWSQWARLDARLAEIWIQCFLRDWKELRYPVLREEVGRLAWPQAMGVLFEQALKLGELLPAERRMLGQLIRATMTGFPRAKGESFSILQNALGSRSSLEDAAQPERSYSKWGYYGRDFFWNKFIPTEKRTELEPQVRSRLLGELLKTRSRISVNDYREYLEGRVSRRVAQLDLESCAALRSQGRTRGRTYLVVGRLGSAR